jgi:hypothetical protein
VAAMHRERPHHCQPSVSRVPVRPTHLQTRPSSPPLPFTPPALPSLPSARAAARRRERRHGRAEARAVAAAAPPPLLLLHCCYCATAAAVLLQLTAVAAAFTIAAEPALSLPAVPSSPLAYSSRCPSAVVLLLLMAARLRLAKPLAGRWPSQPLWPATPLAGRWPS